MRWMPESIDFNTFSDARTYYLEYETGVGTTFPLCSGLYPPHEGECTFLPKPRGDNMI